MKRLFKSGKTAKGVSLTVLGFADIALDAIPIPGAKGGIRAVLDVIKGLDKTSRNSSTLAELESHIRFLVELLEPLTKMDRYNLSSGLKDDVRRFSKDLESISSNVKSKSSTSTIRRFLERHEDENNLHTFAQNLKATLDRFHLSQTLRQEQDLLLRERSALVMSLPRADYAAYDSGRENAPLSCLEGTRVAILAEIMSWLESTESGTPPIYWLNGLAGIGKSTIAKTTAERADEKGLLGGSFFFSRSDRPLHDPQLVFPTLAFQLAQYDNAFKNVIGDAIQQDARLGQKELLPQLEGLIFTPLGNLGSDRRTTLIILDALDECEEKGAATIVRLLLSHATRIPFLRILITSRPEPHISSVFDEERNHAKRILHDIEASVIEQDIRLYIRSELAKIPKKLGLRMVADWTTDGEINALVERSGRLFVYAVTSIRFISDDRVRNPRRHLSIILGFQTAQETGAAPYTQLDNLYMGVLRNSLSNSNRRDVLKLFQIVVGSIVLLREPLPLHSLAQFVRFDMDEVDTALYHLRSVIIPPSNEREAPRIYHPSFRDFIMDASRCSEADFLIVPAPEQERRHAIRCFDLMRVFLKRDVAGISDLSLLNSEVDGFERKVRDALSPEVQYACRYWASHLSRVEFGDKTMVEALGAFSMRSVLVWFEAMSLIGGVSAAANSVRDAHLWAMGSKCELTLVTILSDAYRFILAHAEVIRASALHVYHSALAFTPHETALYKAYSQDANHSIRVLQGMESKWQQDLSALVGHSDVVSSVAFSPDGLRLASGSWDHTLRLWDVMSGARVATLKGHSGSVASVAFSPDGLRLTSGSWDHTLRLWDAMSGTHIATLQGHSERVTSAAFSPDGLWLASGSHDDTLRLWDAISGMHIATLQGHSDSVTSVAFSPDSLRLASGSDDDTVRLWDAISGAHIATLKGHSIPVTSVTFSPDGLRLASGSWDETLRLWDAISGTHIAALKGHSARVTSVAFSFDGLRLASGSHDHSLRLWDAISGAHIATLQNHSGFVTSIAFSPDGLRLASGSWDHTARLWDAMPNAQIATRQGHSEVVSSIAFSPDGLWLASGSQDGNILLWDAILGARIATLEGHSVSITSVAFSPDSLQLASGSWDNTLRLWDATSGTHIGTLEGHSGWVTSVAFSPDGLRLASGSQDDTLRLWDAMSGAHIATLRGHSERVTSVGFLHDGLRLASSSDDGTVRLWDAMSGTHIATHQGHSERLTLTPFSPGGFQPASGSHDDIPWFWDAVSGAHIATLSAPASSASFSVHTHTPISQTHVETFALDFTSEPPHSLDSGSLAMASPPATGLSPLIWSGVGRWIRIQHLEDDNVTHICYIPNLYVPSTRVHASGLPTQSRVAIGCVDGRVIILDIQHHPFVYSLGQVAVPQ